MPATLLLTYCSISIHALREEGDGDGLHRVQIDGQFLSTPSARRATTLELVLSLSGYISIHALREEGDPLFVGNKLRCDVISIHALREEGDPAGRGRRFWLPYFYPRPPRGGRLVPDQRRDNGFLFLSTPSARRATGRVPFGYDYNKISIHALREEGDKQAADMDNPTGTFLSTPSARRATPQQRPDRHCRPISIHALREEGDAAQVHPLPEVWYFYPRPPRGGRR